MSYDDWLYRQADEYWERYVHDEEEEEHKEYISYQCEDCGQGFESEFDTLDEGICPHCGHDNFQE